MCRSGARASLPLGKNAEAASGALGSADGGMGMVTGWNAAPANRAFQARPALT